MACLNIPVPWNEFPTVQPSVNVSDHRPSHSCRSLYSTRLLGTILAVRVLSPTRFTVTPGPGPPPVPMPFTPFAEEDSDSCFTSTASQNAFVDYEYESDIVDQCGDMIDGPEHQDIPQRPSSRLGFHSSPSDDYIADFEDPDEDMSETENWTHIASAGETSHSRSHLTSTSTSSMAYDFDEDITTVASADVLQLHDPSLLSMPTSTSIPDNSYFNPTNPFPLFDDDESDGSDSDSDCSSCENSDDDFEYSLTSISLSSSKPSSSSTAFMAPATHPSRSSVHSLRPPSPTEPKPIAPVRLPTLKSSYNNHGYSRHALLHLKWFWAMREGKWAEDDAPVCDSKAYYGTTSFGPLRSSTQRNLAQRLKLKTPHRNSSLPPMSVHPRRGDIASLRDPYAMHVDRCFVNIPSWTLAKTMYMFDVHVGYEWHSRVTAMRKWQHCDDNVAISQGAEIKKRSGTESHRRKEPSTDSVDDFDLDSESESLGTSASTTSSDDSDATLVEGENEGDLERDDYSTFEAFISGAGPSSPTSPSESSLNTHLKCFSPDSDPIEKPSSKCPSSLSLYAQMPSRSAELLSSLDDDTKSTTPWATNWYRRWEILLDLMHSNWDQCQFFAKLSTNGYPYCAEQCSNNDATGRKGKRRLKRQPRFYFDDENSSEDSDSWEWNSSFDWKNTGQISGVGVQSLDGSVLL